MKTFNREAHWQEIYREKDTSQVSWYQAEPKESLAWIAALNLDKEAAILEVGGGDSRLPDFLLLEGYQNLKVLDISAEALALSKKRLGPESEKLEWIVQDVLDLDLLNTLDLWHDRAVFHFLREESEVKAYVEIAGQAIRPGGHLIVATFSDNGPLKCSGLEIQRYDEKGLEDLFKPHFQRQAADRLIHKTPAAKEQEFLFMHFRRI